MLEQVEVGTGEGLEDLQGAQLQLVSEMLQTWYAAHKGEDWQALRKVTSLRTDAIDIMKTMASNGKKVLVTFHSQTPVARYEIFRLAEDRPQDCRRHGEFRTGDTVTLSHFPDQTNDFFPLGYIGGDQGLVSILDLARNLTEDNATLSVDQQ